MSTGRLGAGDTAIQPTIVDAKGDLIAATAADTVSKLAVGANDTVLTADSSTATGLKWATPAGGGKVLQVVEATTISDTTIASTAMTDTALTATITPSATNSKVLVLINQSATVSSTAAGKIAQFRLLRGATDISSEGGSGLEAAITATALSSNLVSGFFVTYANLDSPNTTSATTYKMQGKVTNTGDSGQVRCQRNNSPSSIILIEIGA